MSLSRISDLSLMCSTLSNDLLLWRSQTQKASHSQADDSSGIRFLHSSNVSKTTKNVQKHFAMTAGCRQVEKLAPGGRDPPNSPALRLRNPDRPEHFFHDDQTSTKRHLNFRMPGFQHVFTVPSVFGHAPRILIIKPRELPPEVIHPFQFIGGQSPLPRAILKPRQ